MIGLGLGFWGLRILPNILHESQIYFLFISPSKRMKFALGDAKKDVVVEGRADP